MEPSLLGRVGFLENGGGSLSLLLVLIVVFGIFVGISYGIYRSRRWYEWKHVRKICRIGFFLFHITFLHILFWCWCELIQPHINIPDNT